MSAFDLFQGTIIALAAVLVFVAQKTQRLGLFVWILGIAIGSHYLIEGAELLGLMQIVIGTLSGLSLFFYGVVFEVEPRDVHWTRNLFALLIGSGFFGVIYFLSPESMDRSTSALSDEWVIAGVIIAFSSLLVIIGSGLMSRPEEGGVE